VNLRSFCITLLFAGLIGLIVLWGILTVRATATPAHFTRTFMQSGHGVVNPDKVNTNAMPRLHITRSSSNELPEQLSGKRAAVAAPQNVLDVPAPTSTDPSANDGLSLGQPKPDANGVGGAYNYLETVNGGLAIFNRNGPQGFATTYQVWFGKANAQFIDPVSMWDDTGNTFMFSILQQNTSDILLSVAQQANATGNWCNYTFSLLPNHDFDKLGVNSNGIYISANILSQSTGQVVNNELIYANRASLETCHSANYNYWTDLTNPDGTIAQAITPARQDTGTAGIEYLVNSIPTGACQLTLWALTGSGSLSNTSIATQCYSPPPQAKQKGSSTRIGTGDCSITQVSYVNGLLTLDTVGSYNWGDGNGQVGVVEWFVLDPNSVSVASQGAFGTPGYSLFYPSTVTTPNGHMLFVYNASGPTIYPSVWYVDQSMNDTHALANGTGSFGTGGVAPWGDYQSAWPDMNMRDPNSVWITGEYARSRISWGTKFDLITP
jgi:hypothetical protein